MDEIAPVYNTANRLIQIIENNALTGEYVYNGKGQRIKKKVGDALTVFHTTRPATSSPSPTAPGA